MSLEFQLVFLVLYFTRMFPTLDSKHKIDYSFHHLTRISPRVPMQACLLLTGGLVWLTLDRSYLQ